MFLYALCVIRVISGGWCPPFRNKRSFFSLAEEQRKSTMPSRTPGKYSLDSATLMMPSSTHTITATKLRGTHSDVGPVSSSHNSSFQMFSGSESVYNTPRSSMCNDIPGQEAQKSGPTFLTGNAVNLCKWEEYVYLCDR